MTFLAHCPFYVTTISTMGQRNISSPGMHERRPAAFLVSHPAVLTA
jgi:hypothetical protein